MLYINEQKINGLLHSAAPVRGPELDTILAKARGLGRLSLEETALLLRVTQKEQLAQLFSAAAYVKDRIYGRRVVLFAPLYISNICDNACLYCAFKSDNPLIKRKALTPQEIKEQVAWLLGRGHKRILAVAGESGLHNRPAIDFYVESIRAIYSVSVRGNRIRRVNMNCAPLSIKEFKQLKDAGIGTYQLFQETYHEPTYRQVHPRGPKSDPDNRLEAAGRAFKAGIDDIGMGVLYGLYDWRFETLALLMHIEYLEKTFGLGPHTISVPRVEPALGVEFTDEMPYRVRDEDFKKLVAVLRLSVPYTGLILSTRETPSLRDELFSLGVSQVSAESRTSPGGYSSCGSRPGDADGQFFLGDQRSLDEVIASLLEKNFIPSFCAACYRKERTGEKFMRLARPGTIKGKCQINALVTLKEYLDDFASDGVRRQGYSLIRSLKGSLNAESRSVLARMFADIDQGVRDEYV
ncbi:MAG TPA: [FeFe] hydrogenase H-cluster radical SAM maturase HydG [Patescibacteria group bacterium]|nr:[FeFe] hydrogenase H-cluster radical SAM maturase HydG [Patescibacteria group bacterium]